MAVLNPNEGLMFTEFEPKVQNRFIFLYQGIPSFMVKSIASPSFTDEEVTLHHINTYRKIRGKRMWSTMNMTMYDPIKPSGAQAVMEWARLAYESVTGRAGYSDFYKKDVSIQVLGPVGDIVSEWVLKGAYIQSSNFGQLDWSNSAAVELSVTLNMDYCILNY